MNNGLGLDPVSFLLGMLAMHFLMKSMKQSRVVALMLGMIFILIFLDVLLRVGALLFYQEWILQNFG